MIKMYKDFQKLMAKGKTKKPDHSMPHCDENDKTK